VLAVALSFFLKFVAYTEDSFAFANGSRQYLERNGLVYTLFCAAILILSIATLATLVFKRRLIVAIIPAVAIGLSLLALQAPSKTQWCVTYFAGYRIRERQSKELEKELNRVPEFASVRLRYEYYTGRNAEWLRVFGSVSDRSVYAELIQVIQNGRDWEINWQVNVDAQ